MFYYLKKKTIILLKYYIKINLKKNMEKTNAGKQSKQAMTL